VTQKKSRIFSKITRGMGMKELALTIPYSFSTQCSAGGVVSAVHQILADLNVAEWNSLLGLYDEYKVDGGIVKYTIGAATPTQIPGTSALSADWIHVMCFDPVDQTPLTSAREGCESLIHKQTFPKYTPYGSVATPGWMGTYDGEHVLKWNAKKFKATNVQVPGGTVAYMPGQWLSMGAAGSNTPVGALKQYMVTSHTAAVNCIVGVHFLHVKFRALK